MALVVQKYGGTSVGSIERIREVARRCIATRKAGNDLVVVVSAMSGETNRLIGLAHQIIDQAGGREYDVLVSTGEQVSIALLAMSIQKEGVPATSFTAHQIKVITDSAHARARIKSIEDTRIRESLARGEIVVIAGFQGIDEHGNITTLGRGGSDTSAVAVAAALEADLCEICTDVDGIFTTDPSICAKARKLDRISYDEMLEMASMGAKVLQTRSVEFAKKYKVPLCVRSSFNDGPGTLVCEEDESMERVVVSGVACNQDEAKVTVRRVPDRPGIAYQIFAPLSDAGIVVDMIIQNVSVDGYTDLTFTVPKADLQQAQALIGEVAPRIGVTDLLADERIAKVSIIGVGMRSHAGVASKMFEVLSREGINIMMISTSEIKVSVVIEDKYVELAVRALHEAFTNSES